MKMIRTLIPTFLLLALLATPGLTQTASAQSKIATVDMHKLLNGYWKTKQANATLEKRKSDLRKDLKDMQDNLEKLQTEYKSLLVQANDPAISDDERSRRKQAVNDKNKEIADARTAFDQFGKQAEVQLQDQVQRITSNLVADIQAAVGTKAKLGGYSMVLNSTSDAIVYNKGDSDLTTDVLAQLNAGAPIDMTPAASPISNPAGMMPMTAPTGKP